MVDIKKLLAEKGSDAGIDGIIKPFLRALLYGSNWFLPNEIPSFGDLVSLVRRGFAGNKDVERLAAFNGVNLDPEWGPEELAGWWKLIMQASADWPSPEEIIDWSRKGLITDDRFDELMRHCKEWADSTDDLKVLAAYDPLTENDILERYRRKLDPEQLALGQLNIIGVRDNEGHRKLEIANNPMPESAIWELFRRDKDYRKRYLADLNNHGYTDRVMTDIAKLVSPLLDDSQITDLWLRDKISRHHAEVMLAQKGYDDEQIKSILILTRSIPTVSEQVRYMVRNVFDPDIVKAFDLDAEFEQKIAPGMALADIQRFHEGHQVPGADKFPMLAWSRANGVSWDQFRAEWRAHWSIPSPTQLYEMYRRLRPSKWKDGKGPGQYGLATTIDDVRRALGENDVLGFWRDRFLAISYHPLGRIDIRRAFNLGIMSEAEASEAYQDIGYEAKDADRLNKIAVAARFDVLIHSPGANAYRKGIATRAEALADVTATGIPIDVANKVLDRAASRAKWDTRQICLSSLRKRYLHGEFPRGELIQKLHGQQVDPDQARMLAERWECEKAASPRQITAERLCKWRMMSIITPEEFATRIGRLGYEASEAANMIAECEGRSKELSQRTIERAASKADAARKSRDRERAKFAKVARAIATAAKRWPKAFGISLDEANAIMTNEVRRLVGEKAWDDSKALATVLAADKRFTGEDADDFHDLVDEVVESVFELENPGS